MAKLLPFPTDQVQRTAAFILRLSKFKPSRKPHAWSNRPEPPEQLGNMLQHLAVMQPATVLVIESVVADILDTIAAS